MKRAAASGSVGRERPQAVSARRIWHVFAYCRPVPAAPRFTT
jgi:hypothetical protein